MFATLRFPMLLVLLLISGPVLSADEEPRIFSFEYKTRIVDIEPGSDPVHVFIPLAVSSDQQLVIAEQITATIEGQIEREDVYGNRYWHGQVAEYDGSPIAITISTTVQRSSKSSGGAVQSTAITAQEREKMARFLKANAKVLVDDPILEPILAEISSQALSDDPADVSRAIYDWVVDNVEYKKVGSGWGNGDTFWACSERYGNCTDFHALFISLARTENIPARFEIGFPVPDSRDAGVIGGYHCWVQLYLPGVGWFPIDASEAFKHPEKRDYFYGAHPQDRIHFSTGRDIRLGESHQGQPLNYFVYPYIEVGGQAYQGKVDTVFSYKNAPRSNSPIAVSSNQ